MTAKIYGKFENKKEGFPNFKLSTDLEGLKKWNPKSKSRKKKSEEQSQPEDQHLVNKFRKINEKIFGEFVAFYDIVPILSGVSAMYPTLIAREEILSRFEKSGSLEDENEKQGTSIYSLNLDEFPSIERKVRKIGSVRSISPLLPRFYILGLVSHYDYFLEQIARAAIEKKPHIIFSKDASVPYADILNLNSVEEVKNSMIEKEVEKLLRSSHEEQLKWFATNLDLAMDPNKDLKSRFIELCERRNLFAHNGGAVSNSYIAKCSKYEIDCNNLKVGDQLSVNSNYLESAIDTLIEMAFQILHVVWEKLEPDASKEHSSALINITFSLIQEERYLMAIRLIEFLLNNKSTKMNESTRKTHVINCSNAKKMAGIEPFDDLIQKEDWTACTSNYLACKYAIQEDVELFISIMEPAVSAKELTLADLREWPVFASMRKNLKVQTAFKEKFGESLIVEKQNEKDLA